MEEESRKGGTRKGRVREMGRKMIRSDGGRGLRGGEEEPQLIHHRLFLNPQPTANVMMTKCHTQIYPTHTTTKPESE